MASASCSDVPRHRGARLDFDLPSFSLGIDTEVFTSIPSFEENGSGREEEEQKSCTLNEERVSDTESEEELGPEEKKSCATNEEIVLDTESEDDIGPEQQRRFKRLKRGPSSTGKAQLQGERGSSRKADNSKRRQSKELSESRTPLYKEPLPFVKGFRDPVPDGPGAAGIETINLELEKAPIRRADRVLPSASDRRGGRKRTEPLQSLAREDSSKFGSQKGVSRLSTQRDGGSIGEGINFNKEPLQSAQNVGNNHPENTLLSSSGLGDMDMEEDDIEEFSDDELFGSGCWTQKDHRSLRPQLVVQTPILLSSSPETSQKSAPSPRPGLKIPGVDLPPKVPLRFSQPANAQKPIKHKDRFWMDDIASGSRVDFPQKSPMRSSQPTTSPKSRREEGNYWKDDFVSGSREDIPPRIPVTSYQPSTVALPTNEEDAFWRDDFVSGSGVDIPPSDPLTSSRPTTAALPTSEEDPCWMQDFISESGWMRTEPDLSGQYQTPQPPKKSTSDGQRANSVPNLLKTSQREAYREGQYETPQPPVKSTSSGQRASTVPNMFKSSQRDQFRDAHVTSFYTETPARRDVVGPSQALRNPGLDQANEDRILAFLRQRFPHYKPVDALLEDGDLDNEPVYIDYRRQFAEGRGITQPRAGNNSTGAGGRWPAVRSINDALCASPIRAQRRNGGKKNSRAKSHAKRQNPGKASSSAGRSSEPGKRGSGKEGPAEGKWRTVHGSRVFIVGGQKMSGKRAYATYQKRAGNPSSKKPKKKRPS